MKSIRCQRVEEVLRESVSAIIHNELKDTSAGIITVTRVECTNDLRFARVFISIMGKEKEEGFSLLKGMLPFIRKKVGQQVRLRFTPEITLVLDKSLDHSIKIEKILQQIKEKDMC